MSLPFHAGALPYTHQALIVKNLVYKSPGISFSTEAGPFQTTAGVWPPFLPMALPPPGTSGTAQTSVVEAGVIE